MARTPFSQKLERRLNVRAVLGGHRSVAEGCVERGAAIACRFVDGVKTRLPNGVELDEVQG